jgi:esterase/lipase superfamily enzyme
MRRDHHSWHSPALGITMELLEIGHAGLPILVFPTSKGKYFEYEDRGMADALADKIDNGWIQLWCVDSIDAYSWYDRSIHPHERARRHDAYETYLIEEVLPLIRHKNPLPELATHGCSFGGFHAINFALKHPDCVTQAISFGGGFDMAGFFGGVKDGPCYFNLPYDYLPNLNDGWFWERYQSIRWILATGEADICRGDNERLSGIFHAKSIPHQLAVWGDDTGHDWPYWMAMARAYF